MPFGKPAHGFATGVKAVGGQVILLVRITLDVEEHLVGEQMIAVVVRPDVHPRPEANAALTNVGALAQNQIISPPV